MDPVKPPGWVEPWKPAPDESLDSAWDRCPDGRWMIAVAIEAGAGPRTVMRAVVACIRALVPAIDDEAPWRGLLSVADAYGRGEMDGSAVRQLLPRGRGAEPEWLRALHRALIDEPIDDRPAFVATATAGMRAALDPNVDAADRARVSAFTIAHLAGAHAVRARKEAHSSSAQMIAEYVRGGGRGIPTVLPPLHSGAWDEAAQAGFTRGLSLCADRIRDLVRKPWSLSGAVT